MRPAFKGLAAVGFEKVTQGDRGQDGDVTPADPEPADPGANDDSLLKVVPKKTITDVKLPGDGQVRLALSPENSPRDVVRVHQFQVSPSAITTRTKGGDLGETRRDGVE